MKSFLNTNAPMVNFPSPDTFSHSFVKSNCTFKSLFLVLDSVTKGSGSTAIFAFF